MREAHRERRGREISTLLEARQGRMRIPHFVGQSRELELGKCDSLGWQSPRAVFVGPSLVICIDAK